jgi:hypothetical protein
MQVMDDQGGPALLKPEKIETDLLTGAKIADRVVLFSKSGERLDGTVTFRVNTREDLLKYLVTDLKEGLWKVQKEDEASPLPIRATRQGGAVYFEGTPGRYTLTRMEETEGTGLWDRFEVVFKNDRHYENPFADVDLQAEFTSPCGHMVKARGFYDGSGIWKLRFMPDQTGEWNYVAWFSDQPHRKIPGTFRCVPSELPGLISADETNPAWFGFRGGKHIFIRSFHVGDRFFASNWPAEKRSDFLDWAEIGRAHV